HQRTRTDSSSRFLDHNCQQFACIRKIVLCPQALPIGIDKKIAMLETMAIYDRFSSLNHSMFTSH
ncbi:MAG: hypothetical protein SGI77_16350, partial [Pirellulaceae bacterium]|nr:hypothetical protein [Pirellulaceae bacterium]